MRSPKHHSHSLTRRVPVAPSAWLVTRGTGRRQQGAVFGCDLCSIGGCNCEREARAFARLLGDGATIVRGGVAA